MRVVAEHDYYTLDQARELIAKEDSIKAYQKECEREEKKERITYYFKQKMLGVALIAISVLLIVIMHDATIAALFVPIGAYIILTNRMVLDDWYKDEMEDKKHEC